MPIPEPILKKPKVVKLPFVGRFDPGMLETIDEFRKRYEGTYLLVSPPDKEPYLGYASAFEDSKILFYNGQDYKHVPLYSDCKLEVVWPETGLFNYKNTMHFVERVPDRQWKRAITPKNVAFHNILTGWLSGYSTGRCKVSTDIIEASLASMASCGISEGIHTLTESKELVSYAMTRSWGVSFHPSVNSKFLLWYNQSLIAEITAKTKKIELIVPVLKQELVDFLRDTKDEKWTVS